MSKKIIN